MAQSPTIYNFDIELSNVDRGTYETLNLRVACQPSETPEFLLTRVLAYCLEYREGISFGKGFTTPGEPGLSVRDLTGAMTVWIDVGAPDPSRLHKASLNVPRVVLYTHREPRMVLAQLASARIHRSGDLEVYSLDRDFLSGLAARLERRTRFALSVS
ncbi:MAG: YaeQ family protein, partial [Gemmatimonadales bacterium]